MDITLHLGAHRTGTTSFQAYLQEVRGTLAAAHWEVWTPRVTRGRVLKGLHPQAPGSAGARQLDHVRMQVDEALSDLYVSEVTQLLISDENMLGMPRRNIRNRALYRDAGWRLSWLDRAFEGRIARVALTIRPQAQYWRSLLTLAVMRGHPIPKRAHFAQIAGAGQGWRETVRIVAEALPGAELLVFPFDLSVARPDRKLARMTGVAELPHRVPPIWLQASPRSGALRKIEHLNGVPEDILPASDTIWCPFSTEQIAEMDALYETDLSWLRAGADGLATFMEMDMEVNGSDQTGTHPATAPMMRGPTDDIEERRMAPDRRTGT
jgi:hypothetical protein